MPLFYVRKPGRDLYLKRHHTFGDPFTAVVMRDEVAHPGIMLRGSDGNMYT
jgi:hypothetical protein